MEFKSGSLPILAPPAAPGRWLKPAAVHPAANEHCVKCGVCAGLCPVGAIAPEDPSRTNHDLCINCMRCVGACPVSSRALPEEFLNMITQMLNQSAAGYKKPAIFL